MNKVYEKPAVIVDEVAAEGSGVQTSVTGYTSSAE